MSETKQFPSGDGSGREASLNANTVLKERYKIIGVAGSGGMGTVYQARDMNFNDVKKLVAIKEMQTHVTDPAMRDSMLKTFQREANLLASLSHPAIPVIFDFFEINRVVYLVMEYINGSDLELLLTKTRDLPIDKVIDWALEMCDVLEYLHSQKPAPIVFRDMKPSNVMIDSNGRVKLIDFGIAKAFVRGVKHTMIGTEGYSAPEQYSGNMTPQSDIYSLGATLHHILTRKDPRIETPFTFHERPIPDFNPGVPPWFVRIIEKALSFKVDERFATCAEMRQAIVDARTQARTAATGAISSAGIFTAMVSGTATEFLPEDKSVGVGSTIQPVWKFKTEDEIRCAPAVVKDIVFAGSYDDNLWALKLQTGELLWKFPTRGGIASSPVVDESNRIVAFGSEDNSFYAVDYRSGRVSWSHTTKNRVRGTARIEHGHIFFGSDDGFIYALGVANGRQLWTFEMGAPVRSRPFVTGDMIIVGAESGELIALGLSGGRKWSYRTKRGIISSPHVNMTEGICYVGSSDGFMYAIDAINGFSSWRFRTGGAVISSPIEHKGLLYFGSTDKYFYAVNAQTGREKWKINLDSPLVASPILVGDSIYLGTTEGVFYCLNIEGGKERWRYRTGGAITAAAVVSGSLILVGSLDHYLYAFPLVS